MVLDGFAENNWQLRIARRKTAIAAMLDVLRFISFSHFPRTSKLLADACYERANSVKGKADSCRRSEAANYQTYCPPNRFLLSCMLTKPAPCNTTCLVSLSRIRYQKVFCP